MEYLPFDTVGLNTDGIDLFYKAYTELKSKFDIQLTGDIDFHLQDFEVFRQYNSVNLRGSFVIKNARTDCYILFIEKYRLVTGVKSGTHEYREFQVWALAYLKHDFGRMLIRRETLADKIIELVHPVEIDFAEDKVFSDTFYVLANDYNKAVSGITREFRNAVMDVRHDDFIIEIVDHTLIIGDNKPATCENVVHLAEFVRRLCSMC